MSDVQDQSPPTPRPELIPVWDLVIEDMQAKQVESGRGVDGFNSAIEIVIADMRERDRLGRERYGTPLMAHNGRDQLVDLYQELLDAAAYSKAALEEGAPVTIHLVYRRLLDDLVLLRAIIHDKIQRRNA